MNMGEKKSIYFIKLEAEYPDVAERYQQKIKVLGDLDPFLIKEEDLSYNPSDFPSITTIDLVTYLVLTTSYYTKEQMKAYKSLNAFKFFQAGFVTQCGVLKINNYSVLVAKVKHSQRLNEAPVQVWIICSSRGDIETAHCSCMAGAGEVCSHVGALLYAAEYITTTRETKSCTDVRSLWNVPRMTQVRCEPLKNMDLGRVETCSRLPSDIPPVSKEELIGALKKLQDAGTSSVLMKLVEPFASELEVPSSSSYNIYKHLYNEEYETLYLEQLLQLAEDYVSINLSEAECNNIEKNTRRQASCNEWFNQRAGRVTASKLKQVCHTSITKPSLTLIKQICYPVKYLFKTQATEWGLAHESVALDAYKQEYAMFHEDFHIKKVGLVIRADLPQFGASPDALVHCTCCGTGCVEIKCPFLLKTLTMEEYAKNKTSCLTLSSGEISLDTKHAYYYQIQQQMAVTKTEYCDFVVWSPNGTFVERINFNEDFWLYHRELALNFHKNVIMPELLGRLFTRSIPSVKLWCICDEPDDRRPMICCDNEYCQKKWYHLECIGLTDIPNEKWICDYCIQNFH